MVDAAHDKEQRARETIQSLKLEISNLSKLVEQGAGLTMGQDHRFVDVNVNKLFNTSKKAILCYSFLCDSMSCHTTRSKNCLMK